MPIDSNCIPRLWKIRRDWRRGGGRIVPAQVFRFLTGNLCLVLADQLLEIAHKLDEDGFLELSQDNTANKEVIANQQKAIALLKDAITPKKKGGSYEGNNATGLKKAVEQALALLEGNNS